MGEITDRKAEKSKQTLKIPIFTSWIELIKKIKEEHSNRREKERERG